ncbi:MAG: CopG family antitoxin [Pseudomonadota bacterium]
MPKSNKPIDDANRQTPSDSEAMLKSIRSRFVSLGDVDLPQPSRECMRELPAIPVFDNEAQEREFWESHDSTEYLDWSKARKVKFPNLKASDPT